ncbi:MAG: HAD family hydrolase [Verrucomicrobia bacterium CG_4_10_14_3_um_filter_43_23]|nr:MAG: hypothetical protein AUJ82_04570 [Verrucomicrobia bacterium CG1_02_43_26]PIP59032.1 MAG: haloacid dehalogenase [Verrucomicrobia bacterium CG22_combo_CG10-13_8_21_14_all_43_17]PIX59129.1 MAG: HAD family hydrolase [Verrucomicrobia bacterium CG_4_10_14_3_um_filter_43_23]PIY61349.1 MAG: HAD family hydrolase [Verrucomicrobia bacterium CG_4_10_14_0_8_um_filter_43_34]PJA44130.1 MAG: HAD family hydrolase [Verrucomicrobia bacterium CG_4_9_14_3_um_filter_43_20]
MITTIVFDLDDTLYPERQFALSGFRAADIFLKQQHNINNFLPIAERAFLYGLRGNIFNVVFDSLGIRDLFLLQECIEVYRKHKPQLTLFDEAQKIIKHYQKTKNLAIITDGLASVQQSKITALHLGEYIEPIIYTDSLGEGCSKPHPAGFTKVMDFFKTSGQNCVYIGDNPSKDFIGAKQLSWKTVRIRRPRGEHAHLQVDQTKEADITISNLLELETIIPA